MTSLYGINYERTYPHMNFDNYSRVGSVKNFDQKIPEKLTMLKFLKTRTEFKTFLDLVLKSKYVKMLDDDMSDVTLFVPTNRAFENLPAIASEYLFSISLNDFIAFHIVKNRLKISDITGRRFYTDTYAMENLLINGLSVSDPMIGVKFKHSTSRPGPNNRSLLINGDISTSNGVIHVISLPLLVGN
jgi:uncharacterized surface protein with fasciclin (FAS1) repeats